MALQKHQLKFATGRLQQDMSNHNAVLEMTPGRKMFTLTATSSYNTSWGPDAIQIPLERAPGWTLGIQN
jgi:hypothetical protein